MESSREYHENLYRKTPLESKISYLDLPVLCDYTLNNKPKKKTMVYVGSLSSSVRSPEYILKVFREIKDKDYEFIFVGDSSNKMLNDYAKEDTRVKVIGRCSHDDALKYEEEADVLINLGNNNPNLTPSKVFEYLSYGKKIISTYPIDNESSIKYLIKYPLSLLLDERDIDYKNCAKKVVDFIDKEYTDVSFAEIEKLFYSNTAKSYLKLLEEL